MNKVKFDHLLATYGAELEKWPEEHRITAKLALTSHSDWEKDVNDARHLDNHLDSLLSSYSVDRSEIAGLEQAILDKTIYKRSALDRFLDWMAPAESIWHPALAACLPILVGLSIGLMVDIGEQYSLEDELTLTGLESATWEIRDE